MQCQSLNSSNYYVESHIWTMSMFKINRASGMALYRAYKKQNKITCIKGKDFNPTSFFTANLSFTGDQSTFVVKSKYKADANALGSLEQYLRNKMPNAFAS